MPRYSPLPATSIDPRNEAELVQAAAQKILEASNGSLNDFSAGNPLSALLEGQAFAAGEFLFWADSLPNKILLEWIGPFLGAMRRLGTPAVAQLELQIPPITESIFIPAGTEFLSDPNKSGGESFPFITTKDHIVSPGDLLVKLSVSSKFVGTKYNIPANSIVRLPSTLSISGATVSNPQPAVGGGDVESFDEVQERFLTLIRRRNPVSKFDWQEFFIDLYGLGTVTIVRPNQTDRYGYNYDLDQRNGNSRGGISFFVLGPGGVELTQEQIERGKRVLDFSVPINLTPHLYPITLDEAHLELDLEVPSGSPYSNDPKSSTLLFRDSLFAILTPGVIFPVNSNPSVGDIESAFNGTITPELRFRDPKVAELRAYNTPYLLNPSLATNSQVYSFERSEYLLNEKDLIRLSEPTEKFYPVLSSFNPESSSKVEQARIGNLQLKKIRTLEFGEYTRGDIVYWPQDSSPGLRVVLESIVIPSQVKVQDFIATGKISDLKTFSAWTEEADYIYSDNGTIDPDIVVYDYAQDEFIPDITSQVPLQYRPGGFAWLVSQNFTLPVATNSLTGAQVEFLVGTTVIPRELRLGESYTQGEWVYTQQVGSGPSTLDEYYQYTDKSLGVLRKFAYVELSFTLDEYDRKIKDYFDEKVAQGSLREIVVRSGDGGLATYKYSPRFKCGDYLEYRDSSSSESSFYIATVPFTPSSNDITDLLKEGVVLPVANNTVDRERFLASILTESTRKPKRMFTFFKGDQTMFRNGGKIEVYVARSNVNPVFDFPVYRENGVFSPLKDSDPTTSSYTPFFRPEYVKNAEDIILGENGKSLFRVMRAFTPAINKSNPMGNLVANSSRIEEYHGNLLRIVSRYDCSEGPLRSSMGEVSSLKLGTSAITLRSSGIVNREEVFLWSNTEVQKESSELFWKGNSLPTTLNYRDGTLAL
jgi:hypothetical protein